MASDLLRESAAHEAGHIIISMRRDDARLEFARASASGRGTTRLTNATELTPERAAEIAVAGRVSEEVLLGLPRRDVPDNDGRLLQLVLARLPGGVDEEHVRARVRRVLEENLATARRVADRLYATPDTDVPYRELAEVAGGPRSAQ